MPRLSDDALPRSERHADLRETSAALIAQATETLADAKAAIARSSATVKNGHAISAESQRIICTYRAGLIGTLCLRGTESQGVNPRVRDVWETALARLLTAGPLQAPAR